MPGEPQVSGAVGEMRAMGSLEPDSGGVGTAAPARRGVLVTGSPRSGTTWVGRMLSLDPGHFYTHEPFNSELRERLPRLLGPPLTPHFRYACVGTELPEVSPFLDYLLGRAHALEGIDPSSWTSEESELFEEIQVELARGSVPVVKDPIGVLAAEWIQDRYDIPVVVVVRHPAEFARSILRLGWDTNPAQFLDQPGFPQTLPEELLDEIGEASGTSDPVLQASLMWKALNFHLHQVSRRRPEAVRAFRHEDLAGDPLTGFERIAEWLGIPGERLLPEIEPYCSGANPAEPDEHWEIRRNSRENRDRWMEYFDEREQRLIREIVEPVSDLYGYVF